MKLILTILFFVFCQDIFCQTSTETDTTKCIMFFCDTSRTHYKEHVHWAFGFEVRERKSRGGIQIELGRFVGETFYWETLNFLDENKKKLPKNVVVLISKKN